MGVARTCALTAVRIAWIWSIAYCSSDAVRRDLMRVRRTGTSLKRIPWDGLVLAAAVLAGAAAAGAPPVDIAFVNIPCWWKGVKRKRIPWVLVDVRQW